MKALSHLVPKCSPENEEMQGSPLRLNNIFLNIFGVLQSISPATICNKSTYTVPKHKPNRQSKQVNL